MAASSGVLRGKGEQLRMEKTEGGPKATASEQSQNGSEQFTASPENCSKSPTGSETSRLQVRTVGRGSPSHINITETASTLSPDSKKRHLYTLSPVVAMTSQPSNESELQLYRVLQRANLLAYYDTFICQGGDDVHQLCEAGEEEFLEIMALVGMASKPLHVRRLQKSLQEWVQNPVAFLAQSLFPGYSPGAGPPPMPPGQQQGRQHQQPQQHMGQQHGYPVPGPAAAAGRAPPPPQPSSLPMGPQMPHPGTGGIAFPSMLTDGHTGLRPQQGNRSRSPVNLAVSSHTVSPVAGNRRRMTASPPLPASLITQSSGPNHAVTITRERQTPPTPSLASGGPSHPTVGPTGGSNQSSPSPTPHNGHGPLVGDTSGDFPGEALRMLLNHSQLVAQATGAMAAASSMTAGGRDMMGLITNEYGQPASPISLTPILVDQQVQRLAEAAERLVKSLPPVDPKMAANKKKVSKELEFVMSLAEDDPRRMEELRKYAAIYGRFDCKRKPEKPLTLHEVSVNEAAAQMCRLMPALLTRRDELFPLARQVVRDSGYQYSKGHSRSTAYGTGKRSFDEGGISGSGNGSNSGDGSSIDGMDSGLKRRKSDLNGSEDHRKRRDDTDSDDSQYSLYSNEENSVSGSSPIGGQNSNRSSLEHTSMNVQSSMDNIASMLGQENGGPGLTNGQGQPPVAGDFSKILPAKKSGNLTGALQLTKQLAAETLMTEGIRVVREFNDTLDPSPEKVNGSQGATKMADSGHFEGWPPEGIDLSVRAIP